MGDIHYMISEAAKGIGVESHVLRYWEEELELTIGRTEMGHRYYTEEDMQLFRCIRRLKDEGVLLKELKILVPEIQKAKKFKKQNDTIVEKSNIVKEDVHTTPEAKGKELLKVPHVDREELPKIKGCKQNKKVNTEEGFVEILKQNNAVLETEICEMVTKSLKKEMVYLLDAKDQLEDDRFRRLDSLIRQQQVQRKEAAKKGAPTLMRHVFGVS
ncbi:MAG: helix-turn-helix domain-containing protein [Eubacteriales bacterium]